MKPKEMRKSDWLKLNFMNNIATSPEEIAHRLKEKQCLGCARSVSALKPVDDTGFLPHYCPECVEATPKVRKSHFDHKVEREKGIANLRDLGE